jgi:hypothetical protein
MRDKKKISKTHRSSPIMISLVPLERSQQDKYNNTKKIMTWIDHTCYQKQVNHSLFLDSKCDLAGHQLLDIIKFILLDIFYNNNNDIVIRVLKSYFDNIFFK